MAREILFRPPDHPTLSQYREVFVGANGAPVQTHAVIKACARGGVKKGQLKDFSADNERTARFCIVGFAK